MRNRGLVGLLLCLATIALLGAAAAVWLDRQALDTPTWSQTSSRLIADPVIRGSVAHYAADELLSGGDIDRAIADVLPAAIADRVQGQLRRSATGIADRLLATGTARRTWARASAQSQRQLLAIVDRRPFTARPVVLDLHSLVGDLLHELTHSSLIGDLPGVQARLLSTEPASAGRLTVLRSDQVSGLREIVVWTRRLSFWLPIAAAALLVLALLAGAGNRALVMRQAAIGIALAGAAAIAARPLLRPVVGSRLHNGALIRTAAEHGWTIATTQLRDVGIMLLVVAAVAMVLGIAGGVLTRGSRRRATAIA